MTFSVRRAPLRLRLGLARARADSAAVRSGRPSSSRWTRGRQLDPIHRALSFVNGALSDCADPHRACFGMGRKKAQLPPPAHLSRFRICPGNVQQFGRGISGMVPGAEWRVFGTAGHAAHVGWSIRCGRLLGLLDAAWTLQWSAFRSHLYLGAACHHWDCFLDGISRRSTIARRKSPHRTHAGSAAKAHRPSWPRTTTPIESCFFLWRSRGTHFREPLLLVPWSR